MSSFQVKNYQMCLRWHINRIVTEGKSKERHVHVTITTETENFRATFPNSNHEDVSGIQEDRLEWWNGDKSEFEGYMTENTLLDTYFQSDVLSFREKARARLSQERGLVEDMVLLQFIPNSSRRFFDECYLHLNTKWKENEFSDVTELAKISEAVWLDFTLAARRMAKILYQRVSGTGDVSSEESNA